MTASDPKLYSSHLERLSPQEWLDFQEHLNALSDYAETVEDGFGSEWSAWCPECGRKSMQVVRPGKIQCPYCG